MQKFKETWLEPNMIGVEKGQSPYRMNCLVSFQMGFTSKSFSAIVTLKAACILWRKYGLGLDLKRSQDSIGWRQTWWTTRKCFFLAASLAKLFRHIVHSNGFSPWRNQKNRRNWIRAESCGFVSSNLAGKGRPYRMNSLMILHVLFKLKGSFAMATLETAWILRRKGGLGK